ncbi:MAG: YdeI/OmpD-associated family protein [Candidatus Saccharimonadales bacterium]
MNIVEISKGTEHALPDDLRAALIKNPKALSVWEDITPLARNEWICWATTVKRKKTRDEHVRRAMEELTRGKRRPCCWSGCIHRTDKVTAAIRYTANKN